MAHFPIHKDYYYHNQNRDINIASNNNNDCCNPKNILENRGVLQPLLNNKTNVENNAIVFKQKIINLTKQTALVALKPQSLDVDVLNRFDGKNAIEDDNVKHANARTNLMKVDELYTEYEKDIWMYLFKHENRTPAIKLTYMIKQKHLNWNMRSTLIDWLASVADEYKMNNQTFHLAVHYLDRFLSHISVTREKFQLVGAAAMLIASKMEEIYPPHLEEWSSLTGDAFTVKQIIKMEQLVLKVLEFQMKPPTMLDFIQQFCVRHNLDKDTMYLAMYVSELVLLDGGDYHAHKPSKLAAGALCLARHTLAKRDMWTDQFEMSIGYSLKQLSPVVQKQQTTLKSSPFKQYQAIQTKYKSHRYRKVAQLKPRILQLDDNPE